MFESSSSCHFFHDLVFFFTFLPWLNLFCLTWVLCSDLLLWRSICCVFFLMSLLINCMSSWAVVIKCQVHQSFLPNNPHMDFYWLIWYAHVFLVCWRIQLFFQIFLLQIVECKQKAIESTPAWEEKGLSLFCCNSEGFGNWNMEYSAVQDHMEMGMIANILGSSLFFCSSVFWCACYPFIAQCLVTWLIGCSALLGPVGGIMLADYYLVRGWALDIDALYSRDEKKLYWYTNGFHLPAMVALVAGILPNVPGFLSMTGVVREVSLVFSVLYNNSWFVGFFLGAVVYWILTKMQNPKTEKRRTIDM